MNKGYKQTDIGVIPSDWDVKTYGDVFHFLKTANYSRAELSQIDEVKYIHYGDIHTRWNFHLDFSENVLPSITDDKVKGYSLIQNGDIIMADASEDYGGIGKSVEVKNIESTKAISGLHTFLFRDIKGYFIDGYKAYIHSIGIVKKQFDELAVGMKVYGVSKTNLKKVLIPIPTKSEQTAIATALSDSDALITSLEKLIAKKRNIKQGAMQELLQPKEGWEVKKLGEIGNVVMGQSPLSEFYNTEGVGLPLIQGNADIENRKTIIRSFTSVITKRGKAGDIIMSVRAPVGEVSKATFNCCLGRGVCSISYKNEYLFHYLIFFEKSWVMLSTGSTFDSVNSKQVKELEIPIPKFEDEQIRIATILSDMDAEIAVFEKKLEKAKMVKQGMMQQLLTGKIRLNYDLCD